MTFETVEHEDGEPPDVGKVFEAAVGLAVQECKRLGYTPSYFIQMLGERGALGTARALINASQVSDGFTRLWELGRLDLTVEAIAERPQFSELFSRAELRTARRRLDDYGYAR